MPAYFFCAESQVSIWPISSFLDFYSLLAISSTKHLSALGSYGRDPQLTLYILNLFYDTHLGEICYNV